MSARCQSTKSAAISGSWINSNIVDYYDGHHSCDEYYFQGESFMPLYMSIYDVNKVVVNFRLEQRSVVYKMGKDEGLYRYIYNKQFKYKLYSTGNRMKLSYKGRLIVLNKVSNKPLSDVFGTYILNKIFDIHKNYSISFLQDSLDSNNYRTIKINKSNFYSSISKIFKCNQTEIVQLGSFKLNNSCIPEAALYYIEDDHIKHSVLGIVISSGTVKFINANNKVILTLGGGLI